jgi:hypothetical protein
VSRDLPPLIKAVRHDLSDWLWHFTRRDRQPFETLKQIVAGTYVRAGKDRYCAESAVCLTEMPLSEAIRQSKVLDEYAYNRFSDYGIGFKKNWIAAKGGLPVIYQSNQIWLPQSLRWRHCELDFTKGIDFTWQREWRVRTDRLCFTKADDVIIVVRNETEATELATDNWECDSERDEVFYDVIWSYVTHDRLAAAKYSGDSALEVLRTVQD